MNDSLKKIRPSDEQPEYFYMKVGFSNSLLETGFDILEEDQEGFLWMGYQGCTRPEVENGLVVNNASWTSDRSRNAKDLDNIYVLTSKENRTKVRLFSFSGTHLYIWKITGEVIEGENGASYKEKILKFFKNNPEHFKWVLSAFGKGKKDGDIDSELTQGRYIPVCCEKRIERINLPASVNSLAVYQYFTRGTVRRLSFIGEGRNEILDGLLPAERLCSIPIYQNDKEEYETRYGQFFRLFFESKRKKNVRFDQFNTGDLPGLLYRTLNPVQIEAFVALLCLDLGLVVDFFTANALDSIDVRARRPKKNDRVKEDLLIGLFNRAGVKKCSPLAEVFEFQCKNYETEQKIKNGAILFTPYKKKKSSGEDEQDQISIDEIIKWDSFKKEDNFPHLHEWCESLERCFK